MRSWSWLLLLSSGVSLHAHAHGDASHEQSSYLVPNGGQWEAHVVAHVDLPGLRIFIEKDGFTWVSTHVNDIAAVHEKRSDSIMVRQHAWKTYFIGSRFEARPVWQEGLDFRLNYFLGNDATCWASDVQPFRVLLLPNYYPGIDLRIDMHKGFKYDFIVHPGADPAQIQASIEGLAPQRQADGSMAYYAETGSWKELAPVAWTSNGARQVAVNASFRQTANRWTFKLGKYNKQDTLVIDPSLVASTYSGSTTDNWGFTATYNAQGHIYLGGVNFAAGYPITLGAYQTAYQGMVEITISKFLADGTGLIYSTYIGGNEDDYVMSLVADSLDNLYLLGKTRSVNFPTTPSAYDRIYNGSTDLVICRLNPAGNAMVASTFLGGSGQEAINSGNGQRYNLNALEFNYGDDSRGEIIIDVQGHVLIASNTTSTNIPTPNGLQTTFGGVQDGYVAKLNSNLSSLLYGTYLGGSGMDAAYGLKSTAGDTIYVTGATFSNNFPVTGLATGHNRQYGGNCDGFLLRMRTAAGVALSGSFVGTGQYDQSYLIETDITGKVYVTGISMGVMPITPVGTYHALNARHFIQRYSANLSVLELSTTVGVPNAPGPSFSPTAFLVDICNKIYLSGWGGSVNATVNTFVSPMAMLPTTPDALLGVTDGSDMYVMVLEENATALLYGTFFGGNQSDEHVDGGTCRFSKEGVIYHAVCAGCRGNDDFPTTPGAYSAINNATTRGRCNAAVFKIDLEYVNPVAGFTTQYLDTTVCLNTPVAFQPTGTQLGTFNWDFGDGGASSSMQNPTHTYLSVGTYQVRLIVSTCIGSDTILQNVVVEPLPVVLIEQIGPACPGDSVLLRGAGGVNYQWQADSTLADSASNETKVLALTSRWYTLTVTDSRGCESTDSIFLAVIDPRAAFLGIDAQWCLGDTFSVEPQLGTYFASFNWLPDPDITNPNALRQVFEQLPPRWTYLQLTDSFGCSYVDSIWLNPTVSVTANGGPDRYVCGDDSVMLTASGGSRFLWSTGDTTASIRVFTTANTAVWVTAFLGNCRSLPDTVRIAYSPVEADFGFSPDTGYAPQEVSFANLSASPGINRFVWDFGDGGSSSEESPVHIYRQPGAYRVVLQVSNTLTGCTDSLAYEFVTIDSILVLIPNAFTPNGDGVNDAFKGVFRNFDSFEFYIFDRWGSLVYLGQDENFEWDGQQNGKACPAGIYPYVFKAIGKNRRPFNLSGQIILIR